MFDEEPDPDPHGECRERIHDLEADNAILSARLDTYRDNDDRIVELEAERDAALADNEKLRNEMSDWYRRRDQWDRDWAALRKRAEAAEAKVRRVEAVMTEWDPYAVSIPVMLRALTGGGVGTPSGEGGDDG